VAGMAAGMLMLYNVPRVGPGGVVVREHWGGSAFSLGKLGFDTKVTVYAGFLALLVNLVVTVVGTIVLRAMKVDDGVDGTQPGDYTAEREDPSVRDLPDPLSDEPLAGPPPGAAAPRR
jgi:SSS family solute:Na+ symporter